MGMATLGGPAEAGEGPIHGAAVSWAGAGEPVTLQRILGGPPLMAVGNSDGDLEMLQYTEGPGPDLAVVVRHDDLARELAYDEGAERVQAEAEQRGWLVVSMKEDFRRVFVGAP
jgi:hypothetical protein